MNGHLILETPSSAGRVFLIHDKRVGSSLGWTIQSRLVIAHHCGLPHVSRQVAPPKVVRQSFSPAGHNGGVGSMFLVTGGAGFIGSNVVASLNEAGRSDIVVNDVLGRDSKWKNLAKRQLADFVPPADLFRWLEGRKLDGVIHLGAISDTTATDGDLVLNVNFRLSLRLLDWCTASRTRL